VESQLLITITSAAVAAVAVLVLVVMAAAVAALEALLAAVLLLAATTAQVEALVRLVLMVEKLLGILVKINIQQVAALAVVASCRELVEPLDTKLVVLFLSLLAVGLAAVGVDLLTAMVALEVLPVLLEQTHPPQTAVVEVAAVDGVLLVAYQLLAVMPEVLVVKLLH
jgi:hypothetical protein